MGGPNCSTANRSCVEGERLMWPDADAGRHGRGAPFRPERSVDLRSGGYLRGDCLRKAVRAKARSVLYIPANAVHSGKAAPDSDVLFSTCNDTSFSLQGIKAS